MGVCKCQGCKARDGFKRDDNNIPEIIFAERDSTLIITLGQLTDWELKIGEEREEYMADVQIRAYIGKDDIPVQGGNRRRVRVRHPRSTLLRRHVRVARHREVT